MWPAYLSVRSLFAASSACVARCVPPASRWVKDSTSSHSVFRCNHHTTKT